MSERPDAGLPPGEERSLHLALGLAERGLGLAPPNPMVGAVVVDPGGRVVGEGWHEGPGTPHAETMALAAAGDAARGATLFVTLEPCAHRGRTPPCAPAVAAAGVARVVMGAVDPNPVVDGRGIRMLRDAGVEVATARGALADRAADLIAAFARHVRTGRPLVTLKMAASLDGRVAARDGSSRWITGAAAREDVHRLRAAADAVVVGAGTAAADDPSLTVRLPGYRGRPPLRVLVDGRGTTPASGALFDGSAPTLVATTSAAGPEARAGWEAARAEVLVLEDEGTGRVPLGSLFDALGKRDVQGVLLEGGPSLAWSAVAARRVDRLVLYVAPKLVGGAGAPGVLGGEGVGSIAEAVPLEIRSVRRLGEDLRIEARPREGDDVHRDR